MQWLPISEAPMDGTPILVYSRYEGIVMARWTRNRHRAFDWVAYADGQDAHDFAESKITVTAPSHFMHLPPPPELEE
jgi:hypothetical protein